MARILRGELRWADLNPVRGREQAGQRPVLIVSQDVFNERSGTVIAVALTSQPQRAGFPLTFELHAKGPPKKIMGQNQPDPNARGGKDRKGDRPGVSGGFGSGY